jgi:hypothetical protein
VPFYIDTFPLGRSHSLREYKQKDKEKRLTGVARKCYGIGKQPCHCPGTLSVLLAE